MIPIAFNIPFSLFHMFFAYILIVFLFTLFQYLLSY